MNNEEIKTLFVLKYGRPNLNSTEWIINLPTEIINILVSDKDITMDGSNEHHVKALSLAFRFSSLTVTYDAQMRFETYIFNSYIKHIHRQRRLALFKKIKDFFI